MGRARDIDRTPQISVVMAVYKPQPDLFRKAVQSIVAQKFQDWELIIVEDPSPQSAAQTLREFQDDRIRHIVNTHRTCLVDQKNRGLAETRGEYIAIMDADDIAHPFRFTKQINFLRHHPEVGVLGSQIAVIDLEDRIVGYRWYPTLHEDIRRAITRIVPFCHPSVILRREVVDRHGGYRFTEIPAAEDYEYWSRLIQEGVRCANIPEVLLYYRIHPDQSKLAKLRETILAVLRVRDLYWSDRLDLMARMQSWAERLLLYAPPGLVAWMLLRGRWNYRPSSASPKLVQTHDYAALLHPRRTAIRCGDAASDVGPAFEDCGSTRNPAADESHALAVAADPALESN